MEAQSPRGITPGQLRMIYGIARRNGLDNEALHDKLRYWTGEESLKALTMAQAKQFIDYLRYNTGEAMDIPDRATDAQRKYIYGLAGQLGMTEDPKRLRRFLRARFGVDDVAFLTLKNAGKVIEGLKAMCARAAKKETK